MTLTLAVPLPDHPPPTPVCLAPAASTPSARWTTATRSARARAARPATRSTGAYRTGTGAAATCVARTPAAEWSAIGQSAFVNQGKALVIDFFFGGGGYVYQRIHIYLCMRLFDRVI